MITIHAWGNNLVLRLDNSRHIQYMAVQSFYSIRTTIASLRTKPTFRACYPESVLSESMALAGPGTERKTTGAWPKPSLEQLHAPLVLRRIPLEHLRRKTHGLTYVLAFPFADLRPLTHYFVKQRGRMRSVGRFQQMSSTR